MALSYLIWNCQGMDTGPGASAGVLCCCHCLVGEVTPSKDLFPYSVYVKP